MQPAEDSAEGESSGFEPRGYILNNNRSYVSDLVRVSLALGLQNFKSILGLLAS